MPELQEILAPLITEAVRRGGDRVDAQLNALRDMLADAPASFERAPCADKGRNTHVAHLWGSDGVWSYCPGADHG